MIKRIHVLFVLTLLTALGLTFFKIPIASSQGIQLVSSRVDGDLPVQDPASQLWQQATAIEVPLSAQNVAKPFLLETKVKAVTARVLQNGTDVAILVEWADETENNSSLATQDFRDAVALQFPQVQGQPFFCMGQVGGNVNLWHWKADWQADITARAEMEDQYPDMYVDYYPYAEVGEREMASAADYTDTNYLPALKAGNLLAATALTTPVEDLNAGGFGTLTSQALEGQNVQGFGVWQDGKWQVIFTRSLASTEVDDVTFVGGNTYSVAFAVWDGANGERNGQKSTSQWVNLQFSGVPEAVAATPTEAAAVPGFLNSTTFTLMLVGIFVVLLITGTIIYFKLPE